MTTERFKGTHVGTNGVIKSPPRQISVEGWTTAQIDLIKNTVCKGATDDELKLFLYVANKTQLDPMARQVYAVKRWDSKLGQEVMQIQISIDGFRLIAERSGKYAGQIGPFWCGKDGKWVDIWLSSEPPFAAKVGVLRSDFKEPLWGVARFDAYVATYRDKKTNKTEISPMWKKMPDLMLAKSAEMLAIRRACPQELSAIYGDDEMDQVDNPVIVEEPIKKVSDINARFEKKDTPVALPAPNPDFVLPLGKHSGLKLAQVPKEDLEALLLGLSKLKMLNNAEEATKKALEEYLAPRV